MTAKPSHTAFSEWIRTAIWPIPFLIIAVSIVIELTLVFFYNDSSLFVVGNGTGNSSLLGVVGTTMFAAISILFSITMMVLALSANQYGSRLLNHFMRSLFNQFVMGYFGGLFIFSLVTMLYADSFSHRVGQILLMIAIFLAVGAIFLFIYFVHNITQAIQAPTIIGRIGNEYKRTLCRRARLGEGALEGEDWPHLPGKPIAIRSLKSGYLQDVHVETLTGLAADIDGVIELVVRPGDYILTDGLVGYVYNQISFGMEEVTRRLGAGLRVGKSSTGEADLENSIRQLVTIALRALSPALTDHFNATNCIDELNGAVFIASQRVFPSGIHRDEQGAVRLMQKTFSFHSLLSLSFDQIRQNGSALPESLFVALYLAEALMNTAAAIRDFERAKMVASYVDTVLQGIEQQKAKLVISDQKALKERREQYQKLMHLASGQLLTN